MADKQREAAQARFNTESPSPPFKSNTTFVVFALSVGRTTEELVGIRSSTPATKALSSIYCGLITISDRPSDEPRYSISQVQTIWLSRPCTESLPGATAIHFLLSSLNLPPSKRKCEHSSPNSNDEANNCHRIPVHKSVASSISGARRAGRRAGCARRRARCRGTG